MLLYNKRQIKYLTDTQSVHHYKQHMRLVEQQQSAAIDWKSLTADQKSRMLVSLVEADQGARIYFSIHTRVRQIIYVQTYLAENRNRAEMLNIIKGSYFSMLVREFVKWQRSNSRKMKGRCRFIQTSSSQVYNI
jgi:hypothetical protein